MHVPALISWVVMRIKMGESKYGSVSGMDDLGEEGRRRRTGIWDLELEMALLRIIQGRGTGFCKE